MLIGDLPIGYNPVKSDIIVFSKDGVHLLKIRYDEFVKNVGITVPKVYYEDHTVGDVNEVGVLKVGENNYPINVPAGGGGGGADILVGTTPPQDNQGANGDLYFVKDSGQKYKYLKFEITGQKKTNAYTQLAEIKFVDSNSKVADLHGIYCKANKPLYIYTQTNEMMFDGFTQTKGLWVASPTVNDPIIIECTLVEPLDISVYSTLQLWTANDAEARDPSGWKLSVSNDLNTWYVVNQESSYTMTSTRQALGYSATLVLPQSSQTFIKQRYFKESGHWIPILD